MRTASRNQELRPPTFKPAGLQAEALLTRPRPVLRAPWSSEVNDGMQTPVPDPIHKAPLNTQQLEISGCKSQAAGRTQPAQRHKFTADDARVTVPSRSTGGNAARLALCQVTTAGLDCGTPLRQPAGSPAPSIGASISRGKGVSKRQTAPPIATRPFPPAPMQLYTANDSQVPQGTSTFTRYHVCLARLLR